MSKLKILLLAAALGFTGTVAQTQVQVKQQCSYEGKPYADGATNPIGQVCNSGTGKLLPKFNRSTASTKAEPFQTAQQMLRGPALGSDPAVARLKMKNPNASAPHAPLMEH